MILYKYVDLKTSNTIMKNSTLRFTKASLLNDPFELTGFHYGEDNFQYDRIIRLMSIADSYGILSLTRNPLNPLMWAHYGKGKKRLRKDVIESDGYNDTHAGIVFGIDMNEAGLNSEGANIIPAKFGSVIYTATKPRSLYEDSLSPMFDSGLEFTFKAENLEALQRIFLFKAAHWSYEEEVRVVRNIGRDSDINNIGIRNIERTAFKEAYIGIRNNYNKSHLIYMKRKIKKHFPMCTVYVCDYSDTEWSFKKTHINDAIKLIV